MLAARGPRQDGELLGLRARAQHQGAAAALGGEASGGDRGAGGATQLAEPLGDLHVAPHRAPQQRHRAAGIGGAHRVVDEVDVGWRSRSRSRAPARRGRTARAARCRRVLAGACGPGAARWWSRRGGGDAVAPEGAEPRAVGPAAAIVLAVVELVVAGEDDRPDRRLDRQRRRVGDGVGDADELDREGRPCVTRWPGTTGTSGGSGTSASASLARTSAMVNGSPTMRPRWARRSRIRWPSAATWSSWPWVSRTAAIGPSPARVDVRQQLLDGAAALRAAREPDAAVDDDPLAAPRDQRHVAADLAQAADRDHSEGARHRAGSRAVGRSRQPAGAAGTGAAGRCRVPYWRSSGVWRSLVARSVRVGEVYQFKSGHPDRRGVSSPASPSPARRGGEATSRPPSAPGRRRTVLPHRGVRARGGGTLPAPIVPYTWNYVGICLVQALAVLAPKAPPTLGWLRARPVYGLIPLAAIGGLVLLLGNVEGGPGFMTDLAAGRDAGPGDGGRLLPAHRLGLAGRTRCSTSSPGRPTRTAPGAENVDAADHHGLRHAGLADGPDRAAPRLGRRHPRGDGGGSCRVLDPGTWAARLAGAQRGGNAGWLPQLRRWSGAPRRGATSSSCSASVVASSTAGRGGGGGGDVRSPHLCVGLHAPRHGHPSGRGARGRRDPLSRLAVTLPLRTQEEELWPPPGSAATSGS